MNRLEQVCLELKEMKEKDQKSIDTANGPNGAFDYEISGNFEK